MKNITVNLFEKETEHGFMPSLTTYLLDKYKKDEEELRPAVLVLPGGGYYYKEPAEGERVALSYNAAGFHAFVLDYCVEPHIHPYPLLSAAKAMEIIRKNAKEWNVNPEMIAICGFSAGGHLAATLSNLWNDSSVFSESKEENLIYRPNASVLCYPVITSGEFAHRNSIKRVSGSEVPCEKWEELSMEKRVNSDTPPTFLWHTFKDSAVPVENSLMYATALRENGIPFEMHIYPDGDHGLVLGTDLTHWGVDRFTRSYPWVKQSVEWLYLQFGITSVEK